jgi:hypothetical protein
VFVKHFVLKHVYALFGGSHLIILFFQYSLTFNSTSLIFYYSLNKKITTNKIFYFSISNILIFLLLIAFVIVVYQAKSKMNFFQTNFLHLPLQLAI